MIVVDWNEWRPQFDREGFALVGCIAPHSVSLLRKCIEGHLDGESAETREFVWEDARGCDHRIWGLEVLEGSLQSLKRQLDPLMASLYGKGTDSMFLAQKVHSRPDGIGSGPLFHRDSFRSQYKAFVYLTQTTSSNGALQIVLRSKGFLRLLGELSKQRSFKMKINSPVVLQNDVLHCVEATAGDIFIVDTSLIHRGLPCNDSDRLNLTLYSFETGTMPDHLDSSPHRIKTVHG